MLTPSARSRAACSRSEPNAKRQQRATGWETRCVTPSPPIHPTPSEVEPPKFIPLPRGGEPPIHPTPSEGEPPIHPFLLRGGEPQFIPPPSRGTPKFIPVSSEEENPNSSLPPFRGEVRWGVGSRESPPSVVPRPGRPRPLPVTPATLRHLCHPLVTPATLRHSCRPPPVIPAQAGTRRAPPPVRASTTRRLTQTASAPFNERRGCSSNPHPQRRFLPTQE